MDAAQLGVPMAALNRSPSVVGSAPGSAPTLRPNSPAAAPARVTQILVAPAPAEEGMNDSKLEAVFQDRRYVLLLCCFLVCCWGVDGSVAGGRCRMWLQRTTDHSSRLMLSGPTATTVPAQWGMQAEYSRGRASIVDYRLQQADVTWQRLSAIDRPIWRLGS